MKTKRKPQLQYEASLLESCRNVMNSYAGAGMGFQSEFLSVFLDTIPLPVFYKDISGNYLGCNKAFENFIGKTKKEIIGRTLAGTWSKEFAEKYESMDRALFEAPGKQIYEWEIQLANRTKREVIFHKTTFTDSSGKTTGLIGIIQDITELKEDIRLLEESGKDLKSTLSFSTEFLMIIDSSGVVLDANEVATYHLKTNLETLKGKNAYDFLPYEVAEYRKKMADKVIAEGKPTHFEDEREGFVVQCSIYPIFNKDEKVERLAVFGMNISTTKKTGKTLQNYGEFKRSIIETSFDGYLYMSVDGNILETNEAYCTMSGYTREELLSMNISDIKCDKSYEEVAAHLCKLIELGKDHYTSKHRTKDGKVLDLEVSATYSEKTGSGLFCFFKDVTTLKQTEAREQHLKQVLSGIRKLNQMIVQEKDPYCLIQQACNVLTETLGYHNAWIALIDENNSVRFTAASGTQNLCKVIHEKLDQKKLPLCVKLALKNERTVVLKQPDADNGECNYSCLSEDMDAMISKLQHEGNIYGVIAALVPRNLAHDKEEIDIFTEIADNLGFALQNKMI